MTSKKQIEANRSNAKKSTGPKTDEGKAKSSINALKHGLTSQRVWLTEEEEGEFKDFRLGLLDELEPIGSLETQFVCRIAAQMWRLARVPGIEAELLVKMSYDTVEERYTSLGDAFHKDIGTYDGSLGRLARYEAILDRGLMRLMNEYRKIQADRRRREKQYVEDCRRAGLPLEYPGAPHGYDVPDSDFPAKNEAIDAGEIVEDFPEETAIATRPSPASGPRNRRERRAAGKAGQGGNGIDNTTERNRGRARPAVPLHDPI